MCYRNTTRSVILRRGISFIAPTVSLFSVDWAVLRHCPNGMHWFSHWDAGKSLRQFLAHETTTTTTRWDTRLRYTGTNPKQLVRVITWNNGSMTKQTRVIHTILFREPPNTLLLQEARNASGAYAAMKVESRAFGYV